MTETYRLDNGLHPIQGAGAREEGIMSALATTYWNELRPSAAGHAVHVVVAEPCEPAGAAPRRKGRKRVTQRIRPARTARAA
jgi:hypothetical protein